MARCRPGLDAVTMNSESEGGERGPGKESLRERKRARNLNSELDSEREEGEREWDWEREREREKERTGIRGDSDAESKIT